MPKLITTYYFLVLSYFCYFFEAPDGPNPPLRPGEDPGNNRGTPRRLGGERGNNRATVVGPPLDSGKNRGISREQPGGGPNRAMCRKPHKTLKCAENLQKILKVPKIFKNLEM